MPRGYIRLAEDINISLCGAGIFAGTPMVNVTFHGCKLQCKYCELYTCKIRGKVYRRLFFTPEEIAERIQSFGVNTVCFKGGEVFERGFWVYKIIRSLPLGKYFFYVQSNGTKYNNTLRKRHIIHFYSFTPKPSTDFTGGHSYINYKALNNFITKLSANMFELKFIVSTDKDIETVKACLKEINSRCKNKIQRRQIPVFFIPMFIEGPTMYKNIERLDRISKCVLTDRELTDYNLKMGLPISRLISMPKLEYGKENIEKSRFICF